LLELAKVSHDLGCEGTPPTVNLLLELGFTLQELQALGPAPLLSALAASARVSVWPARWLAAVGVLDDSLGPNKGKLAEALPFFQVLTMLRETSLAVHLDSLADWRLHRLLKNNDVRMALTSLTGTHHRLFAAPCTRHTAIGRRYCVLPAAATRRCLYAHDGATAHPANAAPSYRRL
jgi:hypothetical protein